MDYLAERTQITRSCATGSSIGGIGAAAPNGGSSRVCCRGVDHSPRSVWGADQKCVAYASACNDRLGREEQIALLASLVGMSRAVSTYFLAADPGDP